MLTVPARSLSSAHRRKVIELVIRDPLPLMDPFDPATTVVARKPGVQP